jgi:hypothetical protein
MKIIFILTTPPFVKGDTGGFLMNSPKSPLPPLYQRGEEIKSTFAGMTALTYIVAGVIS